MDSTNEDTSSKISSEKYEDTTNIYVGPTGSNDVDGLTEKEKWQVLKIVIAVILGSMVISGTTALWFLLQRLTETPALP